MREISTLLAFGILLWTATDVTHGWRLALKAQAAAVGIEEREPRSVRTSKPAKRIRLCKTEPATSTQKCLAKADLDRILLMAVLRAAAAEAQP